MATLTINIPDTLKSEIQEIAKADWVNLTFIINNLLKAYKDWKAKIWMIFEDNKKTKFEKDFKKNLEEFFDDLKNWTLEKKCRPLDELFNELENK